MVSRSDKNIPVGRFDIAGAVGLGLNTVGRQIFRFAVLTTLILGTLALILTGIFLGYIKPLMSGPDGQIIFSLNRLPAAAVALVIFSIGVAWLVSVLFSAAVTDMTLRKLGDDRSSVRLALVTAIRRFVPTVLQRVVFYAKISLVAVPLALTFLIGGYMGGPPGGFVPWLLTFMGPILALFVVVRMNLTSAFKTTALVGEGKGVFGSLVRSAELTRGNRLRLLLLSGFFFLLAAIPAGIWFIGIGSAALNLVVVAIYAGYLVFIWVWAIAATTAACCKVIVATVA